ncbi:MAG: cytochrome c3 family protein [Candidatus Thiodiazotropha sp. L084R]
MKLVTQLVALPNGLGIVTILLGLLLVSWETGATVNAKYLFDLQAEFNYPSAVKVSDDGMAYVLDGVNGRVVMFNPEGEALGSFSTPGEDSLSLPMDLALYGNEVIVADSGNNRLVLFSRQGDFSRTIPLPKGEQKVEPSPTGLTVIDDLVYWSDRANSRVCSTKLSTGVQVKCWGGFGSQEGEFRYPFMMATDRDNYLYIVDVLNGRIQIFNERGRPFGAVERFGVTDKSLLRPNGLSLGQNDQMLVTDSYTGRILRFDGRSFIDTVKDESGKDLVFDQPVGIAQWKDRVYIVEMAKHRVRVLQLYESNNNSKPDQTETHFSKPTRQDCVTCHLSWSEDYQEDLLQRGPMPPVGSKAMCMSCHHGAVIDSRTTLGEGEQHPDYYHSKKDQYFEQIDDRGDPQPELYPFVEEKIPYCGTCHTPHRFDDEETGLTQHNENLWMRDSNKDSEFCRQCHESLYAEGEEMARELGIHPVSIDLEEPVEINGKKLNRLNCESCHKVHGGGGNSALLVVSKEEVGALCAACHTRHHAESLQEAQNKGVHPVNIDLDEPVTIQDKELTRVDCLSCHSVHAGHKQTPSLIETNSDGQLCESCHENEMSVVNTDHDLRDTAPKSKNLLDETPKQAGLCGSCHSMHRNETEEPMLSIAGQLPEESESSHLKRDRLCQNCHHDEGIGKKRVVTDYTHPYQDLVMISDPEHMPLLDSDENVKDAGQIACITCHDPHDWSPWEADEVEYHAVLKAGKNEDDGTTLNSFLRQKYTKDGFCIECHGLETRIKYKYYHDKRSRPNRAEYLK